MHSSTPGKRESSTSTLRNIFKNQESVFTLRWFKKKWMGSYQRGNKKERKASRRDWVLSLGNRTPMSFRTENEEKALLNPKKGRNSNAFVLNTRFSTINNPIQDHRHYSIRNARSPQPDWRNFLTSPQIDDSNRLTPSENSTHKVSESSICSRKEIREELRKKILVTKDTSSGRKKKKEITAFLSLPKKFNKDLMNQVITNLLEKKKVKERLPPNLKNDPEFQRRISRYSILSPIPRRSKFVGMDDSRYY